MPGGFIEALQAVMSPEGLNLLVIGSIIGIIVGLIPGLSGVTGLAMALPFTLAMTPTGALAFFAGLSGAPRFTGAITSILLNIPGTPVNAATTFDGYPMAQRGEAQRALAIAATTSALGTLFGMVVLLCLMYLVMFIIRSVGAVELFALAVLALATIAFASTTEVGGFLRGLASGGLGVMVGLMGVATVTGFPRWNFGSDYYLYEGVRLIPFFVGIFAIAQIIRFAVDDPDNPPAKSAPSKAGKAGGVKLGILDAFIHWRTLLRGSAIGSVIGVLPGVGGTAANFLSYSWEKAASKHPQRFGTGVPEGIVAAESSDNAEGVAQLVTTLSFGVPGSSEGAIILGLLTLQGFITGPLLMQQHPEVLWVLVIGTFLSVMAVSGIGLATTGLMSRVTLIPLTYLVPVCLIASLVGAYSGEQNLWDLALALALGVFGYFFFKYKFSPTALVIGYVLARMTEDSFVLAYQMSGGGYSIFFSSPFALLIWAILLGMAVLMWRSSKNLDKSDAATQATPPSLWSGLFGLGLAVWTAVLTFTSMEYAFLARLVPQVIGVPTTLLLAVTAVSDLKRWFQARPHPDLRVRDSNANGVPTRTRRFLLTIGWLFGLFVLIYFVGFLWGATIGAFVYITIDRLTGAQKHIHRSKPLATVLAAGATAAAIALLLIAGARVGVYGFQGVLFGAQPPLW